MSEPFLGEIMIVGFNFAPRGWAQCNGQILPINQNQSLFSLLGTTFGGDGRTTFALPGLRSRTPIHIGKANGGVSHTLGQKGGAENVALLESDMPAHTHVLQASSTDGNTPVAKGNILAREVGGGYKQSPDRASFIEMRAGTVTNTGANQAHNNMQPFLTLKYIIALRGLFPSRN